jgi:hypothetical protein
MLIVFHAAGRYAGIKFLQQTDIIHGVEIGSIIGAISC